ncbi:hypothetical protein STEG23_023307 [Scotinomys teguina]
MDVDMGRPASWVRSILWECDSDLFNKSSDCLDLSDWFGMWAAGTFFLGPSLSRRLSSPAQPMTLLFYEVKCRWMLKLLLQPIQTLELNHCSDLMADGVRHQPLPLLLIHTSLSEKILDEMHHWPLLY